MKKYIILFLFIASVPVLSQTTFPVNGVKDDRPNRIALIDATAYIRYDKIIEKCTILIEDGKIKSYGTSIPVPENYHKVYLNNQYVYPSFIELISDYGLPKVVKKPKKNEKPVIKSSIDGPFHWNESIKPEYNAGEYFKVDEKRMNAYLKDGFGTVVSHQRDGIARGTGALIDLAPKNENEIILNTSVTSHYALKKGVAQQIYPRSLMGVIALIRQTHYDAMWYQESNPDERNLSYEAWNKQKEIPSIVEIFNKHSIARVNALSEELQRNFIVKGTGEEYQVLNEIDQRTRLIVPLALPKPYDLDHILNYDLISTEDLRHWEWAPHNVRILEENNINVALTSDGLGKKEFIKNLRKFKQYGASESYLIKALTYSPASFIGAENILGSLETGKKANFIVCSDNIFNDKSDIVENWVNGELIYRNNKHNLLITLPNYIIDIKAQNLVLLVSDHKGKIIYDNDTLETKLTQKENIISFGMETDSISLQFTGWMSRNNEVHGQMVDQNGKIESWTGTFDVQVTQDKNNDEKDKKDTVLTCISELCHPFIDYGRALVPESKPTLFKNCTVWTNEKEGILLNTDVLIRNGKITQIGKNIAINDVEEIDGSGLHLTSGIIDEHSHIAIYKGVNEGTQASSAEVRIGDVVNPSDINIYRQLGGGVTTAQLLHGSANPIGGQSALIKLKWGKPASEMKIKDADHFIKFALGENVKQSNWGDHNNIRFPQTRMGVEQVYYDMFYRARKYDKEWAAYNALKGGKRKRALAPRKDLELEALSEILNKKRFITCHSYQQGEINMLMHVADSLGFKINTFTHILEGYKVADKMKTHGVGASTFSDWWAYKFEVNDAIPYNAAILNNMGIVTAINSDDAEMGRRLNQEAAKTIKYGGLTEEEAWKTVTLNPAKLLHLNDRTGSIKIGKDADVVLWSGHPLSIYSKVLKTYIEGVKYYDYEEMKRTNDTLTRERNRIIFKMQKAIENGEKPVEFSPKKDKVYHCDTE